jgi:hypothetical protein
VKAEGNTSLPENRERQGTNPVPFASQSQSPTSVVPLQATPYTGFDLWLHRLNVLVFVFLCAAMGVLLVIVPWWPQWTDNHFLLGHPALYAFVAGGFARGVCSGLGVLDIWIGFSAAIHYREDKPA